MGNKKLDGYIVVLDDLGMSLERDEVAIRLVQQGNIDRVSIVTSLGDCSYIKKELSGLLVKKDIHLNATQNGEYNTVFEPSFIQSVYDRALFLLRLHFKKSTLKDIARSWESQIEKFHDIFGVYPDGINTHEHIHLIPALFPVVVELARTYGIEYIRIGKQPSVIANDYRVKLLNCWHKKNIQHLTESQIKTSASLHSFNWRAMTLEEITRLIPKNSELIFHPQYKKDVLFLEGLG